MRRGQAGDMAEPGGVGYPTGPEGASDHSRSVGAEKRGENDSRQTEMRIVRFWPECNNPLPQQSPPPESAVEIQNVIGHHATAGEQGWRKRSRPSDHRPCGIQRNRIHGSGVTAHLADTGLNGMAYDVSTQTGLLRHSACSPIQPAAAHFS
jgi:hypothetical protein